MPLTNMLNDKLYKSSCTIEPKLRFVADSDYSALRTQRLDNARSKVSDAWLDVAVFTFSTGTNISKLIVN